MLPSTPEWEQYAQPEAAAYLRYPPETAVAVRTKSGPVSAEARAAPELPRPSAQDSSPDSHAQALEQASTEPQAHGPTEVLPEPAEPEAQAVQQVSHAAQARRAASVSYAV
jgi:hypothetical protein